MNKKQVSILDYQRQDNRLLNPDFYSIPKKNDTGVDYSTLISNQRARAETNDKMVLTEDYLDQGLPPTNFLSPSVK